MNNFRWDEIQASSATVEALKYGRRLLDKILIAFHQACDARDVDIAEDLLFTLGALAKQAGPVEGQERRKAATIIIDANYRLWNLKQAQTGTPPNATRDLARP